MVNAQQPWQKVQDFFAVPWGKLGEYFLPEIVVFYVNIFIVQKCFGLHEGASPGGLLNLYAFYILLMRIPFLDVEV